MAVLGGYPGSRALLSSAVGVWLQSQEKGKGPSQLSLGAGKPSERFPENTEVLSAPDRGREGEPQGEGQCQRGGKAQSPVLSKVSISVPAYFCASCPGGGPSHRGHTGDPRAVLHR